MIFRNHFEKKVRSPNLIAETHHLCHQPPAFRSTLERITCTPFANRKQRERPPFNPLLCSAMSCSVWTPHRGANAEMCVNRSGSYLSNSEKPLRSHFPQVGQEIDRRYRQKRFSEHNTKCTLAAARKCFRFVKRKHRRQPPNTYHQIYAQLNLVRSRQSACCSLVHAKKPLSTA